MVTCSFVGGILRPWIEACKIGRHIMQDNSTGVVIMGIVRRGDLVGEKIRGRDTPVSVPYLPHHATTTLNA